MSVWLGIAGLTLLAVLPILWPLLRPAQRVNDRLDHDLEVYRDQLREVEAELAANALTEQEADETKREIERRILRAAEHGQSHSVSLAPSAMTAVVIALMLPALTLLLYTQLGLPEEKDQPLAEREISVPAPAPAQQNLTEDQNQQIIEMVSRLAKRLENQPDDRDGWILLGRSYAALNRFDDAAKVLRRALDLSNDDAELQVAFGDILTKAAGGTVTPEALRAFKTAQALAPKQLAARYFLALADLQAGQPQSAYDAWLALYNELPADSDNRAALAEQIRRVAQQIGVDPTNDLAEAATPSERKTAPPLKSDAAPGPDRAAMAAAADLSPSERQEFIQSMVQRLADRLKDEPGDFSGWMRLGKAYGVLGKKAESAGAYGHAAALRPKDPEPLNAQVIVLIKDAPPEQVLPETTLEILRKLETLQPNNPRALWFLGMVDAGAGRAKTAMERWQRLRDQLPKGSKERESLNAAIKRLETAK
ncbi:MAG: c-type cytochrome biogenesis protein CcmI [Rhodospirillaceae bacterium]|nr:c-type cytochrome biogenesis protein CcmI [Rhodospirillaceae bacterium]